MNKIGKLTTFARLLNEANSIIIPKVQRDYAYGRKEETKVVEILDGLLTSMLTAVKNNEPVILDFVYGGSYVQKNKKSGGLIPLDGQQRLTTLFLLHYYASLLHSDVDNELSEEELSIKRENESERIEKLLKFKYETRQSATEFCSGLIKDIRPNLLKRYCPGTNKIKDLIIDDSKYLGTYDSDPTIVSMLNVLEAIENKCLEMDVLQLSPSIWDRLFDRVNVMFYSLSLDDFGLTDDLFIKMNSRGKKLTQFEIFKADMMAIIKREGEELKDSFSKKMDTEWIDIIWGNTEKSLDDKRTGLDVNRRNMSEQGCGIDVVFSDKESIEKVADVFDTLYQINKNEGFPNLWNKYFYMSEAAVGDDDKIRLFRRQKDSSVFELAMNDSLSVPDMVYLYSLLLLYNKKDDYDDNTTKQCLRIIRNLMTTNVRLVDARTEKLHGFLQEVKYIIENKGVVKSVGKEDPLIIDGEEHSMSFVQNAWNEEFIKQHLPNDGDYEKLLKYENHKVLSCSLSLFLEYCTVESVVDTVKLFGLLQKFESVFDNNYGQNLDKIRIALLDKNIEYMQWDVSLDRSSGTRRYFLTDEGKLSYFFFLFLQRQNQRSILEILEHMPASQGLLSPEEKCKEFGNEDWRYYLAKYPTESNRMYTRYGIMMWDDKDARPLELIILNSSQHSGDNLEWSMMNHILYGKLNNGVAYSLDAHGCSPVVITSSASTLNFKQEGWRLHTTKDIVPLLEGDSGIDCSKQGDEDYLIRFAQESHIMDYVELGLLIVEKLEEIAAKDCQQQEKDNNIEENNEDIETERIDR